MTDTKKRDGSDSLDELVICKRTRTCKISLNEDHAHPKGAKVQGSIRGETVALWTDINHGRAWAHMTPKQARALARFLNEAANEIDHR